MEAWMVGRMKTCMACLTESAVGRRRGAPTCRWQPTLGIMRRWARQAMQLECAWRRQGSSGLSVAATGEQSQLCKWPGASRLLASLARCHLESMLGDVLGSDAWVACDMVHLAIRRIGKTIGKQPCSSRASVVVVDGLRALDEWVSRHVGHSGSVAPFRKNMRSTCSACAVG